MRNTVAYIKSTYLQKMVEERRVRIFMYLIYRPLSFYLTPLFLSLSFSANAITVIGLILALCLPIIAIFGGQFGFIYVSITSFSCLVLDCIDGNTARVTKKGGFLGPYLDSLTGKIFWIMLYLAIGVLVQQEHSKILFVSSNGILIGLSAATIDLLGRGSRDYVKLTFPDLSPVYFSEKASFLSTIKSTILGLRHLIPFLLILFSSFSLTHVLLIGMVIHCVSILCYSQTKIILSLYAHTPI